MLWKGLQNKINRMIVLTVKIPWIIGRLESDGNFKRKAKETFPAKEKVNDGWVNVWWREAAGKTLWRPTVACRWPQLKFRGRRNVGTSWGTSTMNSAALRQQRENTTRVQEASPEKNEQAHHTWKWCPVRQLQARGQWRVLSWRRVGETRDGRRELAETPQWTRGHENIIPSYNLPQLLKITLEILCSF